MPNRVDRNASSANRMRRNFQRIAEGAVSSTLTNKITAIAPLTGGGAIKNNPSIGIAQATTSTSGYLSSTDWNLFNSGGSTAANYLPASTQLSTTAPLAGGGSLSTGLVLSLPQASSTANGWLSSTDWNAFNSAAGAAPGLSTVLGAGNRADGRSIFMGSTSTSTGTGGGTLFMNGGSLVADGGINTRGATIVSASITIGTGGSLIFSGINNTIVFQGSKVGIVRMNGGRIDMQGGPFQMNGGSGTAGSTLNLDGGLLDFGTNAGGTPATSTAPAGWLKVSVPSGSTAYLPYYR